MQYKKGDRVRIKGWADPQNQGINSKDWNESDLGTIINLTGYESVVHVRPDSERSVFSFHTSRLELISPKTESTTRYVWRNSTFQGFYPAVNTALVVAETKERATELLNAELRRRGIPGEVEPEDVWLVQTDEERVIVLNGGEY